MQALRESVKGWHLAGDDVVSSYLRHPEMHCAAGRRGVAASEVIDTLLGAIGLIDIDRAHPLAAAKSAHGLRSAEAIHLATALAVDADILVTYDLELPEAAAGEGLRALAPDAAASAAAEPPRES